LKRVVLDTNVTIAAFFWSGYPRIVYDLIKEQKITMFLSEEMEKELIRVLGYSKFGLSPKEIQPFIKNLRCYAEFVEKKSKISAIVADPTDNIFLECAVDGEANYIISGDKHLLDLGIYNGIQIIKARDFLIKEKYLEK